MSTKKATGRGGVVRELVTPVPGIFQASSAGALIINDTPESIAEKDNAAASRRRVVHSVTRLLVSLGFASFDVACRHITLRRKFSPSFVGSFMYSSNVTKVQRVPFCVRRVYYA